MRIIRHHCGLRPVGAPMHSPNCNQQLCNCVTCRCTHLLARAHAHSKLHKKTHIHTGAPTNVLRMWLKTCRRVHMPHVPGGHTVCVYLKDYTPRCCIGAEGAAPSDSPAAQHPNVSLFLKTFPQNPSQVIHKHLKQQATVKAALECMGGGPSQALNN